MVLNVVLQVVMLSWRYWLPLWISTCTRVMVPVDVTVPSRMNGCPVGTTRPAIG